MPRSDQGPGDAPGTLPFSSRPGSDTFLLSAAGRRPPSQPLPKTVLLPIPDPPLLPGREILEIPDPGVAGLPGRGVPHLIHPGWAESFPWLAQGTTTRGEGDPPFDLRLDGEGRVSDVLPRWESLPSALGCSAVVHARQVHGAGVLGHEPLPPGFHRSDGTADGHATRVPGLLLAVTVADCVPVFLVDEGGRGVALLHAGWRGVAAGILQAGVAALRDRYGIDPGDLHLHLGPAISRACYEVGPEVFGALGEDIPPGPALLDLREVLARRAVSLGIPADHITRSGHCTLRGPGDFFSHRGGDQGRQVAFLGLRGPAWERGW